MSIGRLALVVLAGLIHASWNIGRLGDLVVQPGCYVYVGSAMGSGGLAARVGRHVRTDHCTHWHIDYLRRAARVDAIVYAAGEDRECAWADVALRAPGAVIPLRGFGSSDCGCPAHLVYTPERPLAFLLRQLMALSPELRCIELPAAR